MSKRKVRIAVVGCGNVAQLAHLPAYRNHPDVEVVSLVDEDPVKRRRLAQQYGVTSHYEDLTEMLAREDVDGVDICTPNYLHAPMAIAALRSGRHVLCEKPLARNAVEAQKIVNAAKRRERILMVAMNNRYRGDVEVLERLVGKGELGSVQIVKTGWLRRAQDWKERSWFTNERMSGGGALLDLGLPRMDLAMWITRLKKPTSVTCSIFGKSGRGGVEDSACAMVSFAGGSCLVLEVTWNLLEGKDRSYCQVFGTKGAANLEPLRIHRSVRGQLVNVTPSLQGQRNYYKDSYRKEIEHFVDCIRKKRTPRTTGEEALRVLKILDAMYESASSGREVRFD